MTDLQYRDIQGVLMGRPKKEQTEDTVKDKGTFYFTTGSTLLDLVVGGGERIGFGRGYEAGTIARDWGDSSSSKSFKACELIAANYYKYKDKFKWVYDDCESGFKFDTKSLYGFEIMPQNIEDRFHSKTVEDWYCNLRIFLKSLKDDEIGIYVLDSLDGLSSKELNERGDERLKAYEKGKEFDQGSYQMGSAKFLSQEFFRTLSSDLQDKKCLLYVISQERDNVGGGMYAPKNKASGGRAIRFFETVRIHTKARKKIEKSDLPIGVVVEIDAEKVRNPRPFRKCTIPIYFTYGMDNIGANIDYLYDLRGDSGELLKKSEGIKWDEEELSRDNLIKYIESNHLQEELEKRVVDKWESIEDSIKVERASKYGV